MISMKCMLGMISAAFIVTACGASDSSNSELQSTKSKSVESETVIFDAKVKPINAGINPDAFAYVISGRIGTGSNRCQAAGVKAFLKEVKVGDEIHVVPMLSKPSKTLVRVCTREFMPQFADVTLTVRGYRSLVSNVILKNVGKIGENKNVDELVEVVRETSVSDLAVETLSAVEGEFGYKISGTIMLGSNGCFAAGVKGEFLVQPVGSRISVVPVKKSNAEVLNRICALNYAPVFANIETVVTGKKSEIKTIEILNLDEIGTSKIIDIQ